MDFYDMYITVYDNGIGIKTACEVLDLVLKRVTDRKEIDTYLELKRYFEAVIGLKIQQHYGEHYV